LSFGNVDKAFGSEARLGRNEKNASLAVHKEAFLFLIGYDRWIYLVDTDRSSWEVKRRTRTGFLDFNTIKKCVVEIPAKPMI